MKKEEFLDKLRKGLSGLPKNDIEERLNFYGEMIDDRIEEGLSEEQAVAKIGSVDAVVSQIIADTPLKKIVKEKIQIKRKFSVLEAVLLILGSPIWLSLIITAFAVVLPLYILLWILPWILFVSFASCGLSGIAAGIILAIGGNIFTAVAITGLGILSAGLCIFMFFGCKAAVKGMLLLTKKTAIKIKNRFTLKE